MKSFVSTFTISIVSVVSLFITGCGSSSSDTKAGLFIKAAVYDTNNTATVSDDTLSIYFNRSVDFNTSKEALIKNFDINGSGDFGDLVVVDYNDSIFHRLKITLDANSTKFVPGSIKISLSSASELKKLFTLNKSPIIITSPRPLLKTGQTVSYAAHDDGRYQKGLSRDYTSNDDGTVTDNATGLIWQEADDGEPRDWNSSVDYCRTLERAGLDWRLPTADELIALSDKGTSSPAIDAIFSNTKNERYWSGTDYRSVEDDAWTVDFNDSKTFSTYKETAIHYTRCVHSSDDSSRASYIRDDKNEVVLDASTNLMWQDTSDTIGVDDTKTWSDAIGSCEALTLGGYSDWRLPNLNELNSVTDKSTYGPAMDDEFKNKKTTRFWSSTTEEANSSKAWYSYFYCGCNGVVDKTQKHNVRCVRSVD